MTYWLMKSEPAAYPWSQLIAEGRTSWNGVRNYQANNNMKAMRIGDKAFFYHSNQGLCIVGLMKITGLWHPDPGDPSGKFGMVDVAPAKTLKNPVTLATLKRHPLLSQMVFVRQGRLSVSPVTEAEGREIERLGG
jgi:predicted RNA-binding protein with PUA-like domain